MCVIALSEELYNSTQKELTAFIEETIQELNDIKITFISHNELKKIVKELTQEVNLDNEPVTQDTLKSYVYELPC